MKKNVYRIRFNIFLHNFYFYEKSLLTLSELPPNHIRLIISFANDAVFYKTLHKIPLAASGIILPIRQATFPNPCATIMINYIPFLTQPDPIL